MIAKFKLGTGTAEGEVVKENDKTVWVKLANGKEIKRKKNRDVISYIDKEA